jgi:acetyl esterase/lipase
VRYELDPEVAAALSLVRTEAVGPARVPARGDWRTLREMGNAGQAYMSAITPASQGVTRTGYRAQAPGGARIELRWYQRRDERPGAAVIYAHGGGMVLGSLDSYDTLLDRYVSATGVPFLSVAYRLAPESQGTALAEDVYSAVAWLREHAGELGVVPDRIAVMGDSGGGSPAAGAAILARDRGVPLARQILIYPMLDDRNTEPGTELDAVATWTYDSNWTAWTAVLGSARGTARVPPVAAPARLEEAAGLAPVYIEVGDLDIFRDEDIAYAAKLASSGVPIELHVHPGAPHGFDRLAPGAAVTRRAFTDRIRTISSL